MTKGNDFLDKDLQIGPTPAKAVRHIQMEANHVINTMVRFMDTCSREVETHTRSALAAELGGEAAGMLAIYNAAKTFVDTHAPGVATAALPE